MAIIVDACQVGTEWQYRLWDTQAGHYLNGAHDTLGITMALWHLLGPRGNSGEEEDTGRIFADWIRAARDRRASDLSKKAADAPIPAWRTPSETHPNAGPILVALRRAAVMEQCAQAVLDLEVSRKMVLLSPDAQTLLAKSCVLRELLRTSNTAVIRADARHRDFTQTLVTEIARAWADIVTVETQHVDGTINFTFRLR